ncbi:hypothetical protein LCGC14_1812480 [marine sediment metagenome]|uniref:Uncharacterized protein n=1 Tax=marine sediment metagenome TaxID=412755 RepID=A0A0F9JKY5_9ZZZZ
MEHEWEELYIIRHGETVYAGIERCNNCKTLRFERYGKQPYTYTRLGWASPEEPECKEE